MLDRTAPRDSSVVASKPASTITGLCNYWWCLQELEQTAIDYRGEIDGIMFFGNDSKGELVRQDVIDSLQHDSGIPDEVSDGHIDMKPTVR